MTEPDDAMMAPVRAVVDFMATLDDTRFEGVFADDVIIVENFAPYIFRGADAVARWCVSFRNHAATLAELNAAFGPPQDFSRDGDRAYFVLPTRWTGRTRGKPFEEEGGWAFVLVSEGQSWRVACYAWAVTAFRFVV
jgi:hypothetical protein